MAGRPRSPGRRSGTKGSTSRSKLPQPGSSRRARSRQKSCQLPEAPKQCLFSLENPPVLHPPVVITYFGKRGCMTGRPGARSRVPENTRGARSGASSNSFVLSGTGVSAPYPTGLTSALVRATSGSRRAAGHHPRRHRRTEHPIRHIRTQVLYPGLHRHPTRYRPGKTLLRTQGRLSQFRDPSETGASISRAPPQLGHSISMKSLTVYLFFNIRQILVDRLHIFL